MPKLDWLRKRTRDTRGKIAVSVLLSGIFIALLIVAFMANDSLRHARFTFAQSTATTTVTVLNTPPNWTVDAQEALESSTSSPTNAGSPVSWNGIATDPNSDSFYLLICKTSSTPTAGVGGGAPTCAGGAGNQWAVSSLTSSGSNATSTYTTQASDPQINAWFAWICDNNAGGAQCNGTFKQGTGSTASPFVVNHRPNFTGISNNSPQNPGATVTWTAVASDTDNFTGATDTVQLFVCKSNDFTGSACGSGGIYCSSTASLANPSCSFNLPIPKPDTTYNSYPYVIDQHIFPASGGSEAATTTYTVNDVAPTVSSSSISLLNTTGSSTDPLTLTVPSGQTTGFLVTFTASDNNSCQNAAAGREIASATVDVYRSGLGAANCSSSASYNPNNCYPSGVSTSTWLLSCSQDGGSCAGSSSLTATWTCNFPLFYVADPTDGTLASDTQFFNQNWLTSVRITDDNGLSSPRTEISTGTELASFLAVQLATPSINFGGLSPGTNTGTLSTSTTLQATGNVGINESLSGVDMCPSYPPTCPISATSTIPVNQIQYATSTVAYGSGIALATSTNLFRIQIPKSTSTGAASAGQTFWGLSVPSSIQLSGAYTGQNTFVGVKSNAQVW